MTTNAQLDELDCILAGDDTFAAGGVRSSTSLWSHDAVQSEQGDGAGVICGETYVLVPAARYPNLTTGQACTLNAKPYSVAQKMRIQDGQVLQVIFGDAANG